MDMKAKEGGDKVQHEHNIKMTELQAKRQYQQEALNDIQKKKGMEKEIKHKEEVEDAKKNIRDAVDAAKKAAEKARVATQNLSQGSSPSAPNAGAPPPPRPIFLSAARDKLEHQKRVDGAQNVALDKKKQSQAVRRRAAELERAIAAAKDEVKRRIERELEEACRRAAEVKAARERAAAALKKNQKEERKKEQEIQQKLRHIGRCPVGFVWIKQTGGYRCAGGTHFVTDRGAELGRAMVAAKDEVAEVKAARERTAAALKKKQKEEEEEREKEEEIQQKLRRIGLCPVGYAWIKQSGGYRCAGGSHFVTDGQLGL